MPSRPIDHAMEEDRNDKVQLRQLWVEKIKWYQQNYPGENEYLYLTLPGRDGKDLAALREAGLIAVTETGALTSDSQGKFAAVERDAQAVL